MGANSFISAPTTLELEKIFFNKSKVSYHKSPPGSGVPVAGIILESKLSTSNVKYTFLFFSISFYGTGIPWFTLSLGDLAVKLFVALVMLIPFRMLLGTLKPV